MNLRILWLVAAVLALSYGCAVVRVSFERRNRRDVAELTETVKDQSRVQDSLRSVVANLEARMEAIESGKR